ncbi:hypothetical protein GURKE_02440 [Brevundimonas phage vB_BpoS-Gurke]|uniref:Uncharacterized protein n=1 Tax=Brevundimonas phage vB_BpoS-Gurke TaxID=2948599 RepID=A0A9E7N3A8_9CAUD|nr:hypothetical protein GURKE_02440 [Brevundimonas phage vB_BpoS-Gurke]
MSNWTDDLPVALHPRYEEVYAEPTSSAARAFLTDLRGRVATAEKAVFSLSDQAGFKGFVPPERGGHPVVFSFESLGDLGERFKLLRRSKGPPMATIAKTPEGKAFETVLKAGPAFPDVGEELRHHLNIPSALFYEASGCHGSTSISGLQPPSLAWTPDRMFVWFRNPLRAYDGKLAQFPYATFAFKDDRDHPYPDPAAWRLPAGWDSLTPPDVDVIFAQAKADQDRKERIHG